MYGIGLIFLQGICNWRGEITKPKLENIWLLRVTSCWKLILFKILEKIRVKSASGFQFCSILYNLDIHNLLRVCPSISGAQSMFSIHILI